jgi:predicted nucleic acid-binding protein
MTLLLDTTAFIDLERGRNGAAEALADWQGPVATCQIPLAELRRAEGGAQRANELAAVMTVLPLDAVSADHYAAITNYLRDGSWMIGANDLWIAAVARASGATLLTRHARMFRRVPGLEVLGYGLDPFEIPIEFLQLEEKTS